MAGHGILIDDATQRALGSSVPIRTLGEVLFKGKAAAVEIFAVAPPSQTNASPGDRAPLQFSR